MPRMLPLLRRCQFQPLIEKLIVAMSIVFCIEIQLSECETIDICSNTNTIIRSGRVNISSPSYPDLKEIPESGVRCFCYVLPHPNSNDHFNITPISNSHQGCSRSNDQRCDNTCWSSLDFWFSSPNNNRKFCLPRNNMNFTTGLRAVSVVLTNITYAAKKSYSSYSYNGSFIFKLEADRARGLRINCNSDQATIPPTRTTITTTISTAKRKRRTTRPTKTTASTTKSSTTTSSTFRSSISRSPTTRSLTTISSAKSTTNSIPSMPSTAASTISTTYSTSFSTIDIDSTSASIIITSGDITTSLATYKSSVVDPATSLTTDQSSITRDTATDVATDNRTTIAAKDITTRVTTSEFTTDTDIPKRTSTTASTTDTDISTSLTNVPSTARASTTIIPSTATYTYAKTSTGESTPNPTNRDIDSTAVHDITEYSKYSTGISTDIITTSVEMNSTLIPIPSPSDKPSVIAIIVGVAILTLLLVIATVCVIWCCVKKAKNSRKERFVQFVQSSGNTQCVLTMIDLDGRPQSPKVDSNTSPRHGTRSCFRLPPHQTATEKTPKKCDKTVHYDKPRPGYNRQSSNYTEMGLNSPSRVNMKNISANVYDDLYKIGPQQTSPNPVITITDADSVYYNRQRSPSQQSDIHAYETCYPPDSASSRLGISNSNPNDYDLYAPIRGRGGSIDSTNTENPYSVINENRFYCNIGDGHQDNTETRKNDVNLMENTS